MRIKKIIPVLQVFLIVVIPLLTTGLDLIDDSTLYTRFFGFDTIANVLYTLKADYTQSNQRTIYRDSNRKEFVSLWRLIKSYSNAPIRSEEPYCIGLLEVENPSKVTLPSYAVITLYPDSAPIVATYYEFPRVEGTKIPRKDIIVVGTIADLEKWLLTSKKNIRIKFNMIVSLISIVCGLLVHVHNKQDLSQDEGKNRKEEKGKKLSH